MYRFTSKNSFNLAQTEYRKDIMLLRTTVILFLNRA
jgi:hypothetical protein